MTRPRSTTTPTGRPRRGELGARNRDDGFPTWHGHDLAYLPFHLLATDGATSQTLLDHQLAPVERSGVRPSVVTVTIGGNDVLGWSGDTADAVRAADAAVASRR